MSKILKSITVFSFAISAIIAGLYRCYGEEICLSLAITFGTTFYHLAIRLFVGMLYNAGMNNRADYTKNGISFIHGKIGYTGF